MPQTILMVTPYIIDVPLSVGGTLALHAQRGDKVHVLSMCYPGMPSRVVYPEARTPEGGLYGRFGTKDKFEREVAAVEKAAVAEALGIEPMVTFDYDPNRDALFSDEVVDRTTELLNDLQPDVVIAYWPISNYTDFLGATSAVMRSLCERALRKIPQVYFAETLNGRHTLSFTPSVWVDMTAQMPRKRRAAEVIWEGKNLDYFFNTHSLPMSEFRGRECGACHAEAFVGLHGGFGLQKRPEQDSAANAKPMTMNRAADGLLRRPFAEGIQPRCYGINGIIDNDTARKVYPILTDMEKQP